MLAPIVAQVHLVAALAIHHVTVHRPHHHARVAQVLAAVDVAVDAHHHAAADVQEHQSLHPAQVVQVPAAVVALVVVLLGAQEDAQEVVQVAVLAVVDLGAVHLVLGSARVNVLANVLQVVTEATVAVDVQEVVQAHALGLVYNIALVVATIHVKTPALVHVKRTVA